MQVFGMIIPEDLNESGAKVLRFGQCMINVHVNSVLIAKVELPFESIFSTEIRFCFKHRTGVEHLNENQTQTCKIKCNYAKCLNQIVAWKIPINACAVDSIIRLPIFIWRFSLVQFNFNSVSILHQRLK